MVFAFSYPKSGKSTVNIVDMPLNDTACVFSPDPHHLKANYLRDSGKHLSSVPLPTTCCLESPDVLSNILRKVLLFDQEALRIRRTPPLFRGNKNTQ